VLGSGVRGQRRRDQDAHHGSFDGGGTKEAIEARLRTAAGRDRETPIRTWGDREKLEERLAKTVRRRLRSSRVGAATETAPQASVRKSVEDRGRRGQGGRSRRASSSAAVAALVAGPVSALTKLRESLNRRRGSWEVDVFASALSAPLYWIATNAGSGRFGWW